MDTRLVERLDSLHTNPPDDPYWSDSSWFSWAIPERNINGLFYNHFRPNMNCLLGGPAMWDLSGQHVWEFRYFDWQLMRLLPEGKYGIDYDKYDFETSWGMSIRTLEPLKRYRLGYERDEFKLDLVFEGLCEPNVIGSQVADRFDESFRVHFEQPGRITGRVELAGESFDVDCFSIRDGSHGPRFLETPTPGAYTWSTADEKTGFQFIARDTQRSRDTSVVVGYLMRDGVLSPLEQGIRRVVERNGPRPDVVEVEARDAMGREVHAIGRARVPSEFMLFPDHGLFWTLFRWEYDGVTDAIGEDQEYYGIHDYRRWHRGGPAAWKTR